MSPAAGPRGQLAGLFRAIGVHPDELVTVCHDLGGVFTVTQGTAADAGARAASYVKRANVWHSVSTLRGRMPVGRRGAAADVARVPALFTDLDVGKDQGRGLPDWAAARAVVGALDEHLGVPCPVLVVTGHGVHPYWPVTGGSDVPAAEVILRRFGLLVRRVCQDHGGDVDNVHEPARVLRTPGTFNMKGGTPLPVRLALRQPATPIPLEVLDDVLPPLPAPSSPPVAVGAPGSADAVARLRGLVQHVLDSAVGSRNNRLNWAAFTARNLTGDLGSEPVTAALVAAAVRVGLDETEADRTVRSGLGASG